MKINLYGLGYVGCVSASCLAREGHQVYGIDVDPQKVDLINQGKSPLMEPGLSELIKETVKSGNLKAGVNGSAEADVSIICVGTPSRKNGDIDLSFLLKVAKDIGKNLRKTKRYQVVNLRSTVLPGTTENILIPLLNNVSGKVAGKDFGVCMNPEFLREGTSVEDFYHSPFTVIGELDKKSGDLIAKLYEKISSPLFRPDLKIAEMLKYTCNSFHALKVTFANEIGNFCKKLEIDSHQVMDLFCQDTRLNLSPYYLKPGFAFGGSCLPKDLCALLYQADKLSLSMPMISSILTSNDLQIEKAFELVQKAGKKNIGLFGLSFKNGTDDLRESALVKLAVKLRNGDYNLVIFDKKIISSRIFGANKKYIDQVFPDFSSFLSTSLDEVIQRSEVLVIGNPPENIESLLKKINQDKIIIDLIRICNHSQNCRFGYEGICW
jgi:GDP-mannose 6-dehydrogenase